MDRDLKRLAQHTYDLLIVGGGIYGAWAVRDAALRGLSVALVEKGDFAQATSSNSLRIIHGGLRYLQHLDLQRMRQSIRERAVLLRIAPHLVRPLPCLIPTYGHLKRSRGVFTLALRLNDWVGFDRNRNQQASRRLPASHTVSRDECLQIAPGIVDKDLTGGAIWYDAQVHNSERLVLSLLHSSVNAGAEIANYVKVTGFLMNGNRVLGVKAEDVLSGDEMDIRAKVVLNTSGPWVNQVVQLLDGCRKYRRVGWSKAMNLVVKRRIFPTHAVGLWSQHPLKSGDTFTGNRSRLLFIVPWRDCSLVGTTHEPYRGDPDAFRVTHADIEEFIHEINATYPQAPIKREDVSFFYGGLLPMEEGVGRGGGVSLVKRFRICDHFKEDGIEGLLTVVGVKFTTARDVSRRAVNAVFKKLGKKPPKCLTAKVPIYGGDIDHFDAFLSREIRRRRSDRVDPELVSHLVSTYGSAYPNVLGYLDENPKAGQSLSGSDLTTRAEVVHGIREEMAQKLSDIILRRTDLGSCGIPDDTCLNECANLMADELKWAGARKREEIEEVKNLFVPGE